MSESKVSIALKLPEELISNIDDFLSANTEKCTVKKKITKPSDKRNELDFDPLTGSALLWAALSFVGTFAVSVAASLVASMLYAAAEKRDPQKQPFEIELHFRDGKKLVLRSDEPVDLKYLEVNITKHGIEK